MRLKIPCLLFLSMAIVSPELCSQTEKILYTLQKNHIFSSAKRPDRFVLTVHGNDFSSSTITFVIRSGSGTVLYEDVFSMDTFREFGSTERNDDSLLIVARLAHFFDEENFYSPAIGDTSEMENNAIPGNIWRDVWLDKTAISFHYLISTENGRGIVYSKAKKKVVLYYKCC